MIQHISSILKAFGLKANQISKPPDAMLAQVYLVDDRFILRSRPFKPTTLKRFVSECELCEIVTELTGFRFPKYRRSSSGAHYVIEGINFWTLHKLIPGRPLGSWFKLHHIDPSVNREVMNVLYRLHITTTGCFNEKSIDRTHLLESVRSALIEASDFLSENALERLKIAFDRVKKYCESYPPEVGCFVHGDFHHGNILGHKDRIIGFIDLDWCRVSSPYEDLAFTLMMLLRDYKNWSLNFRWTVYREMLSFYNFKEDAMLLNDYIILYALFDCAVFKRSQFDNAKAFFEYQKRFLEAVCNAMTIEGY
jgi:aminoglycoside phosphotransferase (APT) family kinase protein